MKGMQQSRIDHRIMHVVKNVYSKRNVKLKLSSKVE